MSLQDIILHYHRRYGAFNSQALSEDISQQSVFHRDLHRGLFFDFSGVSRLSPAAQRGLSLLAWSLAYFKAHPEQANSPETLTDLSESTVANYILGCISFVLQAEKDLLTELDSQLSAIYEKASVINQQNRCPVVQKDFPAIFKAANHFIEKHQEAILQAEPNKTLTHIAQSVSQGVTSYLETQPEVKEAHYAEQTRQALQKEIERSAETHSLRLDVNDSESSPRLLIEQANVSGPLSATITNTNTFVVKNQDFGQFQILPLNSKKLAVHCQFTFNAEKGSFVEDNNSVRLSGEWAKDSYHPQPFTRAIKKERRQQLLEAYRKQQGFDIQVVEKLPSQMQPKVIYLLREPMRGYLRYYVLNKEGEPKRCVISQKELKLSGTLSEAQRYILLEHAAKYHLIKRVTSPNEKQEKIENLMKLYESGKTELWAHRRFQTRENASKLANFLTTLFNNLFNPAYPQTYLKVVADVKLGLMSQLNQAVIHNTEIKGKAKFDAIQDFKEQHKGLLNTQQKKGWVRATAANRYLNHHEKAALIGQLKEDLKGQSPERKIAIIQEFQKTHAPVLALHRLGGIGKTTAENYVDNLLSDAMADLKTQLNEEQGPVLQNTFKA